MNDQPTQYQPNQDLTKPGQNPGFDFSKERQKYDEIISQFKAEQDKTEIRRHLRQNKRNVEAERAAKTILEDETIIPDRTIDLNIRRGSTQYIQYVTKAKRLLIITDNDDPGRDLEPLELWFTRGMRYPKWKMPWFKHIDAMSLHGGCAIEVMYDPSKPFNVGLEYIPRSRLLFPVKTQDIQACPHLLREYDLTEVQLAEFAATYGFTPEAVKAIQGRYTAQLTFRKVYRVLCKKGGFVYNSWYSPDYQHGYLRNERIHEIGLYELTPQLEEQAVTDPAWSENRMKLVPGPPSMINTSYQASETLGPKGEILPAPGPDFPSPMVRSTSELVAAPLKLKEYPITWFPYSVTEVEELLEEQGRASLDLHIQEALTHLLTNTVNSSTRASHIYPSVVNEPGQDPGMEELGRIKPGVVLGREITFWQPPWPSAIILSVLQALDVRKANESGNQDFAAVARKDANKTATEMDLSASQAQEQAGVKTEMFSSPFLDVYALAFLIAKHQAIFLLCARPENPSLLLGNFNLQPAGDIEIIKRLEDRQNAKEFFSIIQGTPAAEKLLEFLLEHFFPDQADEWKAALNQGNKDGLIKAMAEILQQIPRDDLDPAQQQQLDSIIATAQGMVAAPGDQGTGQPPAR